MIYFTAYNGKLDKTPQYSFWRRKAPRWRFRLGDSDRQQCQLEDWVLPFDKLRVALSDPAERRSRIGYGATPVVQPSGADQAAVTLGNADGEIGGLPISDPLTQVEVQALWDKSEKLASDLCP